jgi:CheY-like chemotaxis protein/Tfp pilus assembly protein PilZ
MGKRILIVESGIPSVPFAETVLLRREHDVVRAGSGAEALEQVGKIVPDLIISDQQLTDMTADQLANQVREFHKNGSLSILVLGGDPDKVPPGVNKVMAKPVDSRTFNEVCRQLLNIDARKEARLLIYVQVQGYLQSNMFLCNSLNLSASGMLILTAKKLRIGDTVSIQITLPREREKVRVSGSVVREAGEVESRLNAYGVRFEGIEEKDQVRIREFVALAQRRPVGS